MNIQMRITRNRVSHTKKQGGIVLFFALIGLVVLMLAAVALVRSVDTSTVISGNLAFRQSATSSGDAGMEQAIAWITANTANVNANNVAAGYYTSITTLDLANNLTADATWAGSASAGTDASGNTINYVIERMCRTSNQPPTDTDCLYSDTLPPGETYGAGKPIAIKPNTFPFYRITARVTGPRNTISYTQGFVY